MKEVCRDCPRNCGVDRKNQIGYCGANENAHIAKIVKDFAFEEPCIGVCDAVFFSGCSLKCDFCQNRAISRGESGAEYDPQALANLFDELGFSLDLVTPTHYLTVIERALALTKKPHRIIWNTSGYETKDAVRREVKFVDVFLTDYKYASESLSRELSHAPDYPQVIADALPLMNLGNRFNGEIMERGLLVRHLVLPNHSDDSLAVLDSIERLTGRDTFIGLMSQFTPFGDILTRKIKPIEYKRVIAHARKLGFENGYIQELTSATDECIPKF